MFENGLPNTVAYCQLLGTRTPAWTYARSAVVTSLSCACQECEVLVFEGEWL